MKTLWLFLFLIGFASLTRPECTPSCPENCESCNGITLRILSLNTWGLTYFKDQLIPSAEEPWNATSILDELRAAVANSPSPFANLLNVLSTSQLIGLLNPSQKKRERQIAICNYLIEKCFHVVYLQEVWFEKDYNFFANCTKNFYYISDYDGQYCGGINKAVPLNCSGLVTLSKFPLSNQNYVDLVKPNTSTQTELELYLGSFAQRKAMYLDTFINQCHFKLVNTHFSPNGDNPINDRPLRVIQANQVIGGLGCNWTYAIVGMDINDSPLISPNSPYQVLLRNGNLIDSANPTSAKLDSLVFYQTFANPANTWSGDGTGICPQTIDYIMAGNKNYSRSSFEVKKFQVSDLKTGSPCNCSFSDHSATMAIIKTRCRPDSDPDSDYSSSSDSDSVSEFDFGPECNADSISSSDSS